MKLYFLSLKDSHILRYMPIFDYLLFILLIDLQSLNTTICTGKKNKCICENNLR